MEVHDDAFSQEPAADTGIWPVLVAAAQRSLRLTPTGPCEPSSTSTRLGGVPLLDPGTQWPRTAAGEPLCLVGQWKADEINAWLGESRLPAGTMLSFFYDAVQQRAWGFDPGDAQFWRVLSSRVGEAVPVPAPPGAETFTGLALSGRRMLTVPDRWDPVVADFTDRDAVSDVVGDVVGDVYDRIGYDREHPCHRAFGWPEPMQNPMQLECQLVSNGIYLGSPEGLRDPRVAELEGGAAQWQLLWQIDTDDEAGWMWGDVGTIYYWIREEDLAAGDFDRVWMVLQG